MEKVIPSTPPSRNKALALALLGVGLLLVGTTDFLYLPKLFSPSTNPTDYTPVIPASVNFSAPELNLLDLQGNSISLKSLVGKVVLMNNWATWCPPCRDEMPALEAYFKAHQAEGFVIYSVEDGEAASDVAVFVNTYHLTFPVLLDPTHKAYFAFNNPNLPNSYVIDRQGVVRIAWVGAINLQNLEKYLTPLLKE
jgi:peroxiredoxin